MKYAVIDLEMCRVPGSADKGEYRWSRETIQIGAVLLDENLNVVKKFSTFVRPRYGHIDPLTGYLTGITEENVNNADCFEDAMGRFLRWLKDYDVRCVSWSYPVENQIRREAEAKGMNDPRLDALLDSWISCQKLFDERMDADRPLSLEEALSVSDIHNAGMTHDSLVDAYNTALLFKKVSGCPFRLAAG